MKCSHVEGVEMKKIVEHLYVGTVSDIPCAKQAGISILGACKEPLHRQHAKLQGESEEGYVGRAMPKDEPEYLFAERDHALYLNLIDAREAKYIPDEVIDKALEFIDKEVADGRDVLICCNKGESRSPSIALMWMVKNKYFEDIDDMNLMICLIEQNTNVRFNQSEGMREFTKRFIDEYKYNLMEG